MRRRLSGGLQIPTFQRFIICFFGCVGIVCISLVWVVSFVRRRSAELGGSNL